MRFFKLFLISAVVLFLVMAALSLLFPSHLRISRAINIAASGEKVKAEITDLRTWDSWNQFLQLASLTGKQYSSPSNGAGAYMRSDQLEIRILRTTPDAVFLDWRQSKGKSFMGGFNVMQLSPDSLTVQWYMDFHFNWYPWEKFGSMVYDQQFGPLMEASLTNLKHLMESSP